MSTSERRDRERNQRHRLIVKTARQLAEAEGWDAVTTRRLAALVEYSQPVLYSHFDGRAALLGAVAIEGFGELAVSLESARLAEPDPQRSLRAVCAAYLDFAAAQPALYQAMFVLPLEVKFASAETPAALQAAFAQFVAVLGPFAADAALAAELTWSTLHGLATLGGSGRIPGARREARLDLLVRQIVGN